MNIVSHKNIDFLIYRDQILTILKKNAIALTELYGENNNFKIEININSKTKNCNINLQETNL